MVPVEAVVDTLMSTDFSQLLPGSDTQSPITAGSMTQLTDMLDTGRAYWQTSAELKPCLLYAGPKQRAGQKRSYTAGPGNAVAV